MVLLETRYFMLCCLKKLRIYKYISCSTLLAIYMYIYSSLFYYILNINVAYVVMYLKIYIYLNSRNLKPQSVKTDAA